MAKSDGTDGADTVAPIGDDLTAKATQPRLAIVSSSQERPRTSALAEQSAVPESASSASRPGQNNKRKKAGAVGFLLLVGVGACFAWYPLSDRYAPYAGSASVTADVTQISARVSGPVVEVGIKDNAQVTAGDVLFAIDDTTYRMDVELAEAQLAQVLNTVGSGFAAIPAAAARLEQAELALETANEDLDRAQQLFDRGLVAPAKLSVAQAAQRSAILTVDAASSEVERLTLAAGAADSDNPSVRSARATLEKAEFALASTQVVAPSDGYVSNLSLTEGQYVGAGTPAMTFINPATQMIIADFRENQLISVQPGDRAIVTFEAAPGKQFPATVESVAWGINSGRTTVNGLSQSSNDTRWFPPARKIPVRINIEDITAIPANVRLGSEASVLIIPEDGPIPELSKAFLAISGFFAGFN
ncbi:HlyD family secretion protein [Devosia submarina]|uniref:HlyD family secretion protein n=1 Tax=Devosia submarina TaxID=1173082 RepID=UPI0013001D47|nr:HlyD family secretion protein [Devosia submarina]